MANQLISVAELGPGLPGPGPGHQRFLNDIHIEVNDIHTVVNDILLLIHIAY